MTKQDIRRALAKAGETQAFITATQFAECMGMKTANHAKKVFLSKLECVDGKYYSMSRSKICRSTALNGTAHPLPS